MQKMKDLRLLFKKQTGRKTLKLIVIETETETKLFGISEKGL